MEVFDRLHEKGVTRADGRIVKCMAIPHPDYMIEDRLRECLLCEDSELWPVFTPDERDELLFHLLRRLVVGGSLCQYEDSIHPYLNVARLWYKESVGVQRRPAASQAAGGPPIEVRSVAVAVQGLRDAKGLPLPLFAGRDPEHDPRHFMYLVIDPLPRTVVVLYASWIPMW